MFHRNNGIFRYPYVVIPEQRASNFMTSDFFITVFFHQSPIFFGDLLPNQVPQPIPYTEVCVSRISHVHKQATLVLYGVVQ